MRSLVLMMAFILTATLVPGGTRAQQSGSTETGLASGNSECISPESLDLTPEQKARIQTIEHRYNDEMIGVRNELLNKRFELQFILRNPTAEAGRIRAKALEISELQNRCLTLMVDHEIELRAMLSPEQVRASCARIESCVMKNWGEGP